MNNQNTFKNLCVGLICEEKCICEVTYEWIVKVCTLGPVHDEKKKVIRCVQ